MKSICFVTTGEDIATNASSKRALGLANPLSDLGWKVYILMRDAEENRHRCSMECDARTTVIYMSFSSANDERRKKTAAIRELRPDVVYLCAFVYRNKVHVPKGCVKIVEHSELMSTFKSLSIIQRMRHWLFEHLSVIYSDGLLNASRYIEKVYEKRSRRLFKKNIPMLYFPYAYNKSVCVRNDCYGKVFKKEDGVRYFVFLGSLSIEYGAMTMVMAFERVAKYAGNIKLILCGKGPAYESVKEYVASHGLQDTVYMQGYILEEDIPAYFTLADAFVSPMNDTIQDWARCPSKLYMYLPYHKPVVTCKIGEPYEVLQEKGVYYTPSDYKSMADAILSMDKNDYWNMEIDETLYEWHHRGLELSEWIEKNWRK